MIITTQFKDEIEVARCTALDRDTLIGVPTSLIFVDINEDRSPNDKQGYAMAYITPAEARQLAAELVRLADEIERPND